VHDIDHVLNFPQTCLFTPTFAPLGLLKKMKSINHKGRKGITQRTQRA